MTAPRTQAPPAYTNESVREQLELLRRVLACVPARISFPTANPGVVIKREEMDAAIDALSVALTYFDDASKAMAANAFIAAGIVGAATLEALLMALLVLKKEEVVASRAYLLKTSKRKQSLLEFLKHADLGGLLEIAQELNWFRCDGIPSAFHAQFLSQMAPSERDGLVRLLGSISDLGPEAARAARHFRNLVHPARCIRDKVELGSGDGMTGCLFLILAFSALVDNKLSPSPKGMVP